MNSIRGHVDFQRQKRQAQEKAATLLIGTVMAIAKRNWQVDGAADPERAIERLQKALTGNNDEAMVESAEELSEIIVVAVRAGDFNPFFPEEHNIVAMAENIFEGVLERQMAL